MNSMFLFAFVVIAEDKTFDLFKEESKCRVALYRVLFHKLNKLNRIIVMLF